MNCVLKITTKARDFKNTLQIFIQLQKCGLIPNELSKWGNDKK
ncbi:hypothetical protein [Tepidibacter hydrothermalis]|uniref:Mobile element protein n=1 Tax=Tepidibacter hydrothermalis TaxID=3036126 RepID=A0ABY8EGH7_9FIRM|nr:hypothetical protein [Tepidibacter hydrothermalis]WFD12052.1 hypothetical protein P4S50_08230 [Tepidibacter hydrothermalis]